MKNSKQKILFDVSLILFEELIVELGDGQVAGLPEKAISTSDFIGFM